MGEEQGGYRAKSKYKDEAYARGYDLTRYQEDEHKKRRDVNTQRAILRALGRLTDCKNVLDMPCGTGRLALLVRDAGFSYTGCDISQEMIDVAVEKTAGASDIRFVAGDGESLPFADDSVDVALCVRFLNLIPPPPRLRILRELHRVAARHLVIATGYFGRARPVTEWLSRTFAWLFPKIAARHAWHVGLRRDIREAGWREHFWLPYKSRGFFSTTKSIGVFRKDNA